jgi:hypothetical protein
MNWNNTPTPTPEAWTCILYAIELDLKVLRDRDFLAANPRYRAGMLCLYLGMTSLSAEERFRQHTRGIKNVSRIAHDFGQKLRQDMVPVRKPTRRTWVLKHEKTLAWQLRAQGYGIWQA